MHNKNVVFDDTKRDSGSPALSSSVSSESSIVNSQNNSASEKKEAEAREKMNKIAAKTSRILFQCKAVFPFQLFPDEINIEENRVDIIQRTFYRTQEVKTVSIRDITEVSASTTPFLCTLSIAARTFVNNLVKVPYLRPQDATKARRIIEGLKMLDIEGVDTTLLDSKEVVKKAEEIGKINN